MSNYLTKSVTIFVTFYSFTLCQSNDYYYSQVIKTREVFLKKQGIIQGTIVQFRNSSLSPVEVYRGIPYAAPPINQLRFMPPRSPSSWQGIKFTRDFGPVCPQKFPKEDEMTSERRSYVDRLKEFLRYESEDCLYLNIYAPYQEYPRSYPVIVFLHGESFEWNSGNPYDGGVLASYGQVIVVTLNFRLGILGFLKVEAGDTTLQSNFGLVDQLAALLWIKANIAAFGGDPGRVTLMGHGTGAVFASLLSISPMAIYEQNQQLFHRAILMSGTALSDWALVSKPLDVSIQVAQILNCQLMDNFAACLRKKRLDELMAATPIMEPYKTAFGPVVDNFVVPNNPQKSMLNYTDIFKRFELMFGVTELESLHLSLGGDQALFYGLYESKRDEELRKYMRMRCEIKPEACFAQTRARYNYEDRNFQKEQPVYWIQDQPDRATLARDELLDILSDARTVAPLVLTGLYHAAANYQTYFYVFSHKTSSRNYLRNLSFTGEELPYVFGVPIEGPKFHFQDVRYTEDERRLSMTLMECIANFASTGNPAVPRKDYTKVNFSEWHQFYPDWFQFNKEEQFYLKFDIPITREQFYRKEQMEYWINSFPHILNFSQNPLPWNTYNVKPSNPRDKYENFNKGFGNLKRIGNSAETDPFRNRETFGHILTSPPEEVRQSSSTISILVVLGGMFLLANLVFFTFLYIRCIRNKKPSQDNQETPEDEPEDDATLLQGCNIVQMIRKSQAIADDTYDKVPSDSKAKLTRAMSNSTIDAHAKVREWITNEIVLKYSPKVKRKPEKQKKKEKVKEKEQQPTKPMLIKTASIDRSNRRKRADKVSVAIDATPSGRGPSVLMQKPIELSRSFDYAKASPQPLRRSVTLEDFTSPKSTSNSELRKSITNLDLANLNEPQYIKIEHKHSKSDPVQDVDYSAIKRLKTFDPTNLDINVTSKDDNPNILNPLSPEEALMTIKRRNFPKVLPDHPGRQAFLNKRRSMPVHNLYFPPTDKLLYSNSEPYSPTGRNFIRFPPMPPPRTTTLGRQGSNPQPVCISEPMLAEETCSSPEPELSCNNLYIGPLVPKESKKKEQKGIPRAIITTNPNEPIKKVDPKVIVKPSIIRAKCEDKANHPRVVVPDNRPEVHGHKPEGLCFKDKTDEHKDISDKKKKSHIPMLVKSSNTSLNKDTSSPESNSSSPDSNSPSSEGSDTGTVVKRV
ncbi:neuroligin-4, Y-linked-like [Anthonomus grandis grandis]|uniref:neuroligin-4, Y-linked-like n=1 Tax=Anthonomus grandis grandis TaxID=2921223 RepID=UPI0021664EAD|nr:neuroligin-4, Y-linked-like [Anthonomus grandis grandis]